MLKYLIKSILLVVLTLNFLYGQISKEKDSLNLINSAKMLVFQEVISTYDFDSNISVQEVFDSIINKSEVRFLKNNAEIIMDMGEFAAIEIKLKYRSSPFDSVHVFTFVVGFWLQKKDYYYFYRLKLKGFYQNDYHSFLMFMVENNYPNRSALKTIRMIRDNLLIETIDLNCLTEYAMNRTANKYYDCMVANSKLIHPIIIIPNLNRISKIKKYDKLQTSQVHLMGISNKNPLKN